MCRGNPQTGAPAKTFVYLKLKGGDVCVCPKLEQLLYIRRKVANVSALIYQDKSSSPPKTVFFAILMCLGAHKAAYTHPAWLLR